MAKGTLVYDFDFGLAFTFILLTRVFIRGKRKSRRLFGFSNKNICVSALERLFAVYCTAHGFIFSL